MHSIARRLPSVPLLGACSCIVGVLLVSYFILVALVMSYAAITVEYAVSEREEEAAVAALEARYLAAVSAITAADYSALGYAKPLATHFVPAAPTTALR